MTMVNIKGLVTFAPNLGIEVLGVELCHLLKRAEWRTVVRPLASLLGADPDEVVKACEIALAHWQNEDLVDACCGSVGPLFGLGEISFEEFLVRLDEIETIRRALRNRRLIKQSSIRIRRGDFSSRREVLILAMLDAGVPYRCAQTGCRHDGEDLTIDHIKALSRGGTDEVSNLQFMCRSHNSAKGDRDAA